MRTKASMAKQHSNRGKITSQYKQTKGNKTQIVTESMNFNIRQACKGFKEQLAP